MPAPVTPLLDLDLLLTDAERATADRVAALATGWRASIADWFASGDAPVRGIALDLGSAGLLGMSLPEPFGTAAGAVAYGMACMEVEAVDSGLRSLLSVQGSLAMHAIHAFGSPEQAERWLPGMAAGAIVGGFALTEPEAGSNPAECRTTATRTANGWLLQGEKKWITNGPVGDVVVTWARSEEGMLGFVVPVAADGVTMREVPDRLSLRASSCGEMSLEGVELAEEYRLPHARGVKAPLSCLNEARFGIIFGTLGAARDSLLAALDYTMGREQFGKPLAGFQLVQAELADMAAELAAAFSLAVHLGRIKDAGRITPAQVSLGKRTSAATALSIARRARALHGANGVLSEHPPMRHAANLESVVTYEGTAEMHTLVLGQELTGVAAFR